MHTLLPLLQEPTFTHLPRPILQCKYPSPSQRQFVEYLPGLKQNVHEGADRLMRRESNAVDREYPHLGPSLKEGENSVDLNEEPEQREKTGAAPSPWLLRRTGSRPSASPRSFFLTPPWRTGCGGAPAEGMAKPRQSGSSGGGREKRRRRQKAAEVPICEIFFLFRSLAADCGC